ncbi:MAG: EAL domain-containing protein [Gammaproteobacteria bacterium]|jgi:diguanylate cyclase (GGDEF)-like protein|nr:EAL domain-containing protein [Gammaproteobacteria bacterium]
MTLMPGAKGFGLYEASGQHRWIQSDNQMTGMTVELQKQLRVLVNNSAAQRKALMQALSDGHVAYAFPLGDGVRVKLGTMVVLAEGAGTLGREPRSLQMVIQLLRPAIHCISRDMLLQKALGKAQLDLRRQTTELKFVLGLDQMFEPAMSLTAGLEQTLDQALRALDLESISLSMPSYRVYCQRVAKPADQHPEARVPRHVEKNLLAWVSMHRRSVCLPETNPGETIAVDVDPGMPLIACPMPGSSGAIEGVLVATGKRDATLGKDQATVETLARRLALLIESKIDADTGALCRPSFEGELLRLSGSAQEHSLIYMDLDRLTRVRGEFGAQASDDVLRHFCSLVNGRFKEGQVFARLGDSCFGLLMPGVSEEDALQQARQICNAVTSLHYLNGEQGLSMSVSVGVAGSRVADTPSLSLLAVAESACRRAKLHGGNQVELYVDDEATSSRPQGEIFLANYLGNALEEGRFSLVAQAVYDNLERTPCGYFEVFLRLIDENGIEMPPGCFLPVAQRYDMLPAIDRWVVGELLDRLVTKGSEWLSAGPVSGINLSGQTLADADFPQFVEQQLTRSGVPAEALCFEISESAMMSDLKRSKRFMAALRDLGCKIALDDFGSGLSSLPYLESMPVDFVKIDGQRVMAMAGSRVACSIVAAIIAAAKVLGIKTVAGCVENGDVDKLVRESGVDLMQGAFTSSPQPLDSFLHSALAETTARESAQGRRA